MTREIKYRVWDGLKMQPVMALHMFKWHYGWLQRSDDPYVDEAVGTLLQFTGMKDKNGSEIFDGDLVRADKDGLVYKVIWSEWRNGWMFDDLGRTPNDHVGQGLLLDEIVIIGNEYQNPELLK